MSEACACFVKTPGLSPVKTRLAAGVGAAAAAEFYRLSVRAVEAVLGRVEVTPYWAVAEASGLGRWPGFPVVGQGEGALAARLDRVYAGLIDKHEIVYLIGADCPQLSPAAFAAARAALKRGAAFALGPARDGGFYLLAGARAIPRELWLATPMSAPDTAERLAAGLAGVGEVAILAPLSDVDVAEDFAAAAAELRALPSPLAAQVELLQWLDAAGGEARG